MSLLERSINFKMPTIRLIIIIVLILFLYFNHRSRPNIIAVVYRVTDPDLTLDFFFLLSQPLSDVINLLLIINYLQHDFAATADFSYFVFWI